MDALRDYDIEFIKLKDGEHRFEYVLTDSFFKLFNSSLSGEEIRISLSFLRSGSMFTLVFTISGALNVDCDRCLTAISLPVKGKYTVLVKLTDYPVESDDDLIYISSGDYKLNVAQHLYDFVLLSIPIKKTCNDVGLKCDDTVAGKITSVIDIDMPDDNPERDSDETDEEEED